jgi:predicted phosphodiesterase
VRTAVISDIHGNLEALGKVLDDIGNRNVDEIICLGDILGYGPNPVECADLVAERCAFSLMGNHDYAVLYEPTNFNEAAKRAAFWTRNQIELAGKTDQESGMKRLDFLNRLRVRWRYQEQYTCVHGTVRRPINEYLFATDPIDNPLKVEQIFERIEDRCLVGHTHVPGIFTVEPEFYRADELGDQDKDDPQHAGRHEFVEGEKAIMNPGSVGQPRDHDPRASYAILETGEKHFVDFYRIEYDIEVVANKIHETEELDPWLAERLFKGM